MLMRLAVARETARGLERRVSGKKTKKKQTVASWCIHLPFCRKILILGARDWCSEVEGGAKLPRQREEVCFGGGDGPPIGRRRRKRQLCSFELHQWHTSN